MLVDLARNDLSRNCHDVKVDFYKDLQYVMLKNAIREMGGYEADEDID